MSQPSTNNRFEGDTVRLNRKWLYSGGLVAILTLLLTLTWVLPAGAVGRLDRGSLDTDKTYVSPDAKVQPALDAAEDDPHPRAVKVTLTNEDLDGTQTVGRGGDFGQIILTVPQAQSDGVPVVDHGSFSVNIESGDATEETVVLTLKNGDDTVAVGDANDAWATQVKKRLPITGNLVVDEDASTTGVANKITSLSITNAADGIIAISINADLEPEDEIHLSYDTSPQETALVNVLGDSDNFDLVLLESAKGPAGDYSQSFIAAEEVIANIHDGTSGTHAIQHEQHTVPQGLRGYIEVDNETIGRNRFYISVAAAIEGGTEGRVVFPATGGISTASDTAVTGIVGDTVYVQVAKPPIITADTTFAADDDVSIDTSNLTVLNSSDPNTGVLALQLGGTAFNANDIDVDYIGSDSFYITVDHWPIQKDDATNADAVEAADVAIVVPPVNDDDFEKAATADGKLQVLYIADGTGANACAMCRVRIGVVTGPGPLSEENEERRDEPLALNPRVSVVGISYDGSERERVRSGLEAARGESGIAGADDFISELLVSEEFDVTLRWEPVADPTVSTVGMTDEQKLENLLGDIRIVNVNPDAGDGGLASDFATPVNADGRIVTFRLGDSATDVFTDSPDGDQATTGNETFDVAYYYSAGSDPVNALVPSNKIVRPTIAVGAGARVKITSGNDTISVDAEDDAPTYSNPSPGHKAVSPNEDQVVSVDVTDELAGVNQGSISLNVSLDQSGNYQTITKKNNADLDIVEIEGGVRVSISLDDIENINVDADNKPTVYWYVNAKDKAGNSIRSDADAKVDTPTKYQDYRFTVDDSAAELAAAYTGDWFDSTKGEDGEVRGDRRLRGDIRLAASSRANSLRVVFNDAVDCTSIGPEDFTVDGVEPTAAVCHAKGSTGDEDDPIERSVFLTVAAMAPDLTPEVEIVGRIADMGGNITASGTVTAEDGIAPTATLRVDPVLSGEKVTVTVDTDEPIRRRTPDLKLYISDGLDEDFANLNESDTFTVVCDDEGDDDGDTEQQMLREDAEAGKIPATGDCVLALVDSDGNEIASGNALKNTNSDGVELTLSKAPVLDRNGDDKLDYKDVTLAISKTFVEDTGGASVSDVKDEYDAKAGLVTMKIEERTTDSETHGLLWGDEITVTYRGTDFDPAAGLPGVTIGTGTRVSATSWTFDLTITRGDKFAVTAVVEDAGFNERESGAKDPTSGNAIVFEIDRELGQRQAGNTRIVRAPKTDPIHDAAGSLNEPTISDPFFIELSWPGEEDEYPGDSSDLVTLTMAELDGVDVLTDAIRQSNNGFRIGVTGVGLGLHTLTYNAKDAVENTYDRNKTLTFKVNEVPNWQLDLAPGMNLISVPSAPADGNINTIFGDTETVNLIFTFEGAQSKVAIRDTETGMFVGTLDTIDAQHAYWVSAENTSMVQIKIPAASQFSSLPFLEVPGGEWALVPVMSLGKVNSSVPGEGAAPRTPVDPDAYLGEFRTAFGWDGRGWVRIHPDSGDGKDTNDITDDPEVDNEDEGDLPLRVGMGYWVLFDEDAFITP